MFVEDTIVALATPPGPGGIGVIRLSGPGAEAVFTKIFEARHPLPSHRLTYGHLLDEKGNRADECMGVLMRAPKSYTREDVAELHIHGGAVVAQLALKAAMAGGARPAQAGEFTRRAFLNGRIDLSQAEAVMGLISASGEKAANAALRQLEGGASQFILKALDDLYTLLAALEAAIDYPEEVDEAEAIAGLEAGATALAQRLEAAVDERAARILQSGLQVALCGRPNVGKSSLLNTLLGEDKAIVTDVPGTTRDLLTGRLTLGGFAIDLTDMAGLRDTEDKVEQMGIQRAQKAIRQSDCVWILLDSAQVLEAEDKALLTAEYSQPVWVILTKQDLPVRLTPADVQAILPDAPVFSISTLTLEGIGPLKEALIELCGQTQQLMITQPRHLDAARRAAQSLRKAAQCLHKGEPVDLCAVDLHEALSALGEITGDQVTERLLDEIFSSFCVGK